MEYYQERDLEEIVKRTADIFEVEVIDNAALEIALRSRGTPRIANRLLKRVRDFAQIMGMAEWIKQLPIRPCLFLMLMPLVWTILTKNSPHND